MMDASIQPFFVVPADASLDANAELLGSKAAQLARMSRLGLPVPPAFVMPTSLCNGVNQKDGAALQTLKSGLRLGIARLEAATSRRFGDSRLPLFVSVRSGAARSMPGMLDTILDVGMNNDTVQGLIRLTGNPRLAWDSYRRFVQSYSEVVDGVASAEFERPLAAMLGVEDAASEDELDCEALERLTHDFIEIALRAAGSRPPANPLDQLDAAAQAVYASWESARAREYRQINGLHDLVGTAVTVQAMVFGNSGHRSGAGGPSLATPPPAPPSLTSTSCSMLRGRMSFPVAARQATALCWRSGCRMSPKISPSRRGAWSKTSRMRRTSSSRSKTASCIFCKPARPNARHAPRSGSRWIWSAKG